MTQKAHKITSVQCAAPGCKAKLRADNKSGVCRAHNHSEWCACRACNDRRAERGEPRVAIKAAAQVNPRVKVSLAPTPWNP